MIISYKKSKQKWENDVLKSNNRDYSFRSASGEEVDILYYPKEEVTELSKVI